MPNELNQLDATQLVEPEGSPTTSSLLTRIAIGILTVLIIGIGYEQVGEWQDARFLPQIGTSFDIGGRSLNIFCSGEGSPTVIFESGSGLPGYSWVLVQPEISKLTRACWYDRAGYGWSDPGPDPHWSDSVARDLHKLLRAAEIPPPYLLVGHSLGGFDVRAFNGFYPGEVAGMVLVDVPSDEADVQNPREGKPSFQIPRRVTNAFANALTHLGILRLFPRAASLFRLFPRAASLPTEGMTSEQSETLTRLRKQLKEQLAAMREGPTREDARVARATTGLDRLPLIVMSAGKLQPGVPREVQQVKIGLHAELAKRSRRGSHVIVPNSGHMMPLEAPEAVSSSIRDLIVQIRKHVSRTEEALTLHTDLH